MGLQARVPPRVLPLHHVSTDGHCGPDGRFPADKDAAVSHGYGRDILRRRQIFQGRKSNQTQKTPSAQTCLNPGGLGKFDQWFSLPHPVWLHVKSKTKPLLKEKVFSLTVASVLVGTEARSPLASGCSGLDLQSAAHL